MEKNEHKRDGFRSRSGFIIACIGSAVGMGNIWRFPMLVSTWGGLTFLLPYFIFVILIASTGVIEEFALGRAGGAGPMGSFGMCTELRYGKRRIGERIGYIPILGSLALAIGYTCVMGWIFKYTFLSFTGDLFSMGQDMDVINGTFGGTASAWGANIWIIVAIAASFAIVSFGNGYSSCFVVGGNQDKRIFIFLGKVECFAYCPVKVQCFANHIVLVILVPAFVYLRPFYHKHEPFLVTAQLVDSQLCGICQQVRVAPRGRLYCVFGY